MPKKLDDYTTDERFMWREIEHKLDRHNHLMELLRTLFGLCTLVLQIVILLKLFDFI